MYDLWTLTLTFKFLNLLTLRYENINSDDENIDFKYNSRNIFKLNFSNNIIKIIVYSLSILYMIDNFLTLLFILQFMFMFI